MSPSRFFLFMMICIVFIGNHCAAAKAQEPAGPAGFVYQDQNKRDPFWRLVTPEGTIVTYDTDLMISDMILEGVIYDPEERSMAIINGKVMSKDQKIGLFTVKEIHQDHVLLSKGQEDFILRMKKEE